MVIEESASLFDVRSSLDECRSVRITRNISSLSQNIYAPHNMKVFEYNLILLFRLARYNHFSVSTKGSMLRRSPVLEELFIVVIGTKGRGPLSISPFRYILRAMQGRGQFYAKGDNFMHEPSRFLNLSPCNGLLHHAPPLCTNFCSNHHHLITIQLYFFDLSGRSGSKALRWNWESRIYPSSF